MASITLKTDKFVAATTPGIYLRSQKNPVLGSAPIGAAIATATVQTDQSLTFNGLLDDTDYTVYLSGVYVDCSTRTGKRGQRFGALQPLSDTQARRWSGSAAVVESMRRADAAGNTAAPTSGTLLLAGGGIIPAGETITRVGFVSATTAGATLTNQSFAIINADTLAVLGVTANDTSTAWAANTLKELVLTAPLTFNDDTPVYLGLLVTATTVPTLAGALLQTAAIAALAPVLGGTSNAGLTTPASITALVTVTAPTGTIGIPYAYAR